MLATKYPLPPTTKVNSVLRTFHFEIGRHRVDAGLGAFFIGQARGRTTDADPAEDITADVNR